MVLYLVGKDTVFCLAVFYYCTAGQAIVRYLVGQDIV
jgi:hypothetical protein